MLACITAPRMSRSMYAPRTGEMQIAAELCAFLQEKSFGYIRLRAETLTRSHGN